MDILQFSRIHGERLDLRLIVPDDAGYVWSLRTDASLSAYLSPVSGTVEDQRRWIEDYSSRAASGRELYYVIQRKDGARCGLVRLYDIGGGRFTWGSWILDVNKPAKAALESALLSFGVAFDGLGLLEGRIDVRIDNQRALAFYRRLGLTETHRTDRDIYFTYGFSRYRDDREKLWRIVREGADMQQDRKVIDEIALPQIHDPRGDLTFVEGRTHIPFDIARVYYLYNVPVDSQRGGHAHRQLQQVIFALSGSFCVRTDNGHDKAAFWLRDPRKGIYLSRMVWREIDSFSQGAVCMVLASHPYDESDYYREYDEFIKAARGDAA